MPIAGILKWSPKSVKATIFEKSQISEKFAGPNKNCSNSVIFGTNDLKSFLFESWEHIFCKSSPWLTHLLDFEPQILFKVKNQNFEILKFSSRPTLRNPGSGPKHFFGPKTFFIRSHMSQLEFWYFSLDSGDFTR